MKKGKSISDWMTSALVKDASQSSHPSQPAPPSHRRKVAKQQPIKAHASKDKATPLAAGTLISDCDVPWSAKYQPQTASDLAVHKKKVAEVQQWLEFALSPQACHPVLLLTGPPGCGKTATLKALSHDLNCSILEWVNPSTEGQNELQGHPGDLVLYPESQTKQFRNFITRANRYPSLQVGGADMIVAKKVVLVEEFPNAFIRDPSKFHDIMRFVGGRLHYPLVFIVSESHREVAGSSSLFNKSSLSKMDIHTISFNPVAHTSMVKTLQKIASTECQKGEGSKALSHHRGAVPKFHMPPREVIESLAEMSAGDIRSATNALQFACLKDSSALFSSSGGPPHQYAKSSSRKRKGSSSVLGGSRLKRQVSSLPTSGSLAGIGGRDNALFLFRALGKILYCKRDTENEAVSPSLQLPPCLEQHKRPPLLVNPESVVELSHLSSEMFVLYLHQNYIAFYEDLDDIASGVEYLSDSDILGKLWTDSKEARASLQSYSSSVGCRGLMLSNNPLHHSSNGGKWRPLHKPQWNSISKQYRENCQAARGLFLHLGASLHAHLWTPIELQTELLPYLALINIPLRNPGQVSLLQTLTYFGSGFHRLRPEALGEKDVEDTLDAEHEQPVNPSLLPTLLSTNGGSVAPASSGVVDPPQLHKPSSQGTQTLSQDVRMVVTEDDEVECEIDDFDDDVLW